MRDVFLDANVFDYAFKHGLDLVVELPPDRYHVLIPSEVEIELRHIGPDKAQLVAFIEDTIARRPIGTQRYYGFERTDTLEPIRRQAGFGEAGSWAPGSVLKFKRDHQHRIKPRVRKTGLFDNEADLALAARAGEAVVLSLNTKSSQPIAVAKANSGQVVFLDTFVPGSMLLGDFIEAELAKHLPVTSRKS